MKAFNNLIGMLGILVFLIFTTAVYADNVTRFQFTQPNFTGGGGNSLFDVAVVEQRGGGEYLKLQKEDLELNVERKKVGLENDQVILENNKVNLEANKMNLESKKNPPQAASSPTPPEPEPQTIYNVENYYENTVDGAENLYWANSGEVYRSVDEINELKEVTTVEIDNTGNLSYYEDDVTNQIESGEYYDTDIAYGTGEIEQNPTSNMNVLIESGN